MNKMSDEIIELKTVEEMHQMTIKEIRNYCTELMHIWGIATKIRDYRIAIGDDYNLLLLEAKNVVITGDEEE
tara:strand:- start:212 stop:427 length:216 start_codon:yes stop_codon:yes gene_type:complete